MIRVLLYCCGREIKRLLPLVLKTKWQNFHMQLSIRSSLYTIIHINIKSTARKKKKTHGPVAKPTDHCRTNIAYKFFSTAQQSTAQLTTHLVRIPPVGLAQEFECSQDVAWVLRRQKTHKAGNDDGNEGINKQNKKSLRTSNPALAFVFGILVL